MPTCFDLTSGAGSLLNARYGQRSGRARHSIENFRLVTSLYTAPNDRFEGWSSLKRPQTPPDDYIERGNELTGLTALQQSKDWKLLRGASSQRPFRLFLAFYHKTGVGNYEQCIAHPCGNPL